MLRVIPRITGIFVARHLRIRYSAGQDLAYIASWNGLHIDRDVSNWPGDGGRKMLFLRTRGLTIRLERPHDRFEMWIRLDEQAPEVIRDLRDMREVLDKIRDTVEDYQRPRRS